MALIVCRECGKKISSEAQVCVNCGCPIRQQQPKFNGVYRRTLFHGLQEVYCPKCNSSNCQHYKEQVVIPAKTKTKYKANLNPLKPFTLVDKKEKVVRKEQSYTSDKFMCNNCGKIFM